MRTRMSERGHDFITRTHTGLIYVDAHVPRDGDSMSSLNPDRLAKMKKLADEKGEGWKMPPSVMPDDTADEDRNWIMPRRMPQPIKTFKQPLT